MTDTPQVLLAHHLKTLKLPTFLREYDKIARQCASEGVDHVRYLLRLARARADRPRAPHGRAAHQGGALPRGQEPRQLRLQGHPSLNKALVLELARCEYIEPARTSSRSATVGPARPTSPSVSAWRPARRASRSASSPPPRWSHELIEARDDKQLLRFQKKLATYKLLIVDELGFVPLSKTGAELLFEVFSQRYERGLDPGHHQSAVRRMDRGVRLRAPHRRAPRSPHPPRQHPRDER